MSLLLLSRKESRSRVRVGPKMVRPKPKVIEANVILIGIMKKEKEKGRSRQKKKKKEEIGLRSKVKVRTMLTVMTANVMRTPPPARIQTPVESRTQSIIGSKSDTRGQRLSQTGMLMEIKSERVMMMEEIKSERIILMEIKCKRRNSNRNTWSIVRKTKSN